MEGTVINAVDGAIDSGDPPESRSTIIGSQTYIVSQMMTVQKIENFSYSEESYLHE